MSRTAYVVEKLVNSDSLHVWIPVSGVRPLEEARELQRGFKEAYPFNSYRVTAYTQAMEAKE